MSDEYEGPHSGRAPPQRIKPPKEPPKIKSGTWVEVLPDHPDLRCFGEVRLCLPGARVEVVFRNGGWLVVDRRDIRIVEKKKPHGPR